MSDSLLNRAAVRRFTLECAAKNRFHSFTRVAPEFLDALDRDLRLLIAKRILAHPSKGTTIK